MLAILQLDTNFPRPIGDAANPASYSFPAKTYVVQETSVQNVIYRDAEFDMDLLMPFIAAGKQAVDEGASLIGTSCGFLAPYQAAISAALKVPFLASSLCAIPDLLQHYKQILILTIDAQSHRSKPWLKALIPAEDMDRVTIVGLEKDSHLYQVIRGNLAILNQQLAERDVLNMLNYAQSKRISEADTVLCECTNFGVYTTALQRAIKPATLTTYNSLLCDLWFNHKPTFKA